MNASSNTNPENAKSADMGDDMKGQARRLAEEQKKAGAERLGGVAGSIRAAADGLKEQMPGTASYVHDAADRLETVATRLRNQTLDDLFANVNAFARGQPAVFFGGALIAGFALSRFIKSSNTHQ